MKPLTITGLIFTLFCAVGSIVAQTPDNKTTVKQHSERLMLEVFRPVPDSLASSIQVMDSAMAAGWWQRLQTENQKGKAAPARSFDHDALLKRLLEQQPDPLTRPPVSVRTEAGQGNQVVVYLKNQTNDRISDITVAADQLPEKWSSQPAERKIEILSPGRQAMVTFELTGPGNNPGQVGFGLHTSQGVSLGWTALVTLPDGSRQKGLPKTFEVHGNYPNPFNPSTTISYSLPQAMEVRLEIFNLLGQRVAVLVDGAQKAGLQNVTWDAGNIASGTYFYRIVAEGADGQRFVEQKSMVLIK